MKIKRTVKIFIYALCAIALYALIVGVMSIRYIVVDGKKYNPSAVALTLLSDTDFRDDSDYSFLSEFKRLKTLDVSDIKLSSEGYKNIVSKVSPDVRIIHRIQIGEKRFESDIEELNLTNDLISYVEEEPELLSGFDSLKVFTADKVSSVNKLYDMVQSVKSTNPNVKCTYSTEFKGIKLDNTTEKLILNNISLKNTKTVKKILKLFPTIKRAEMCDCGISDDEMGQLREEFPDVKIVWMLHFLIYEVRTDVQVFSTLVSNWIAYADEKTFAPLFKYCTDLRALDLGHWDHISDISEIRNLKNLEILIISDNSISDISPLADLKHMKYMDIRYNKIIDVSPLTQLKEIQFLEVGGNRLSNAEVLSQCRSLKYLYIEDTILPDSTINKLTKELPEKCEFKMKYTRGHKWYKRIIAMFRNWKKVKVYHDWEHVEFYK